MLLSSSLTFEINSSYKFTDSGFFNEGQGGDAVLRISNKVVGEKNTTGTSCYLKQSILYVLCHCCLASEISF